MGKLDSYDELKQNCESILNILVNDYESSKNYVIIKVLIYIKRIILLSDIKN